MRRVVGALPFLLIAGLAQPAQAYDEDFELSRLGNPDRLATQEPIAADPLAQERFARFASDFALALAPLPGASIASVGDAGFSLTFSADIAFRSTEQQLSGGGPSERVWPTEANSQSALFLPTLKLRKGLPFSLELGADVAYIANSSMVATTGVVKWSLFEGFQWLPDVGVRGFVTTVLGTGPLNLVVGGWDIGGSYRLPLAGGAEATLYGGFQRIGLNASTNNIDFRPMQEDQSAPTSDDTVFKELPIDKWYDPTTVFGRWYFGAQVRFAMLLLGVDGATGSGRNRISANSDTFVETSAFKLALRAGVQF